MKAKLTSVEKVKALAKKLLSKLSHGKGGYHGPPKGKKQYTRKEKHVKSRLL